MSNATKVIDIARHIVAEFESWQSMMAAKPGVYSAQAMVSTGLLSALRDALAENTITATRIDGSTFEVPVATESNIPKAPECLVRTWME